MVSLQVDSSNFLGGEIDSYKYVLEGPYGKFQIPSKWLRLLNVSGFHNMNLTYAKYRSIKDVFGSKLNGKAF